MHRILILIVSGAVILIGGCVPDLSRDQQEVIGGNPTSAGAYPATGALILHGGTNGTPEQYVDCTGTLVAPDLVITAAHCVHPTLTQNQTPDFTLALDGMNATAAQIHAGATAIPYPSFNPQNQPSTSVGDEHDIGVLVLADPIYGVDYARLPRMGETAGISTGAEVAIVGYGFTVEKDLNHYGIKNNATTHLTDIGTHEIGVASPGEPQNCQGDSGGPAMVDGSGGVRIISVVSRGTTSDPSNCTQGGIHTRIDPYLQWIDQQVDDIPCGSGLSADCPMADAGTTGTGTPDAGSGGGGNGGPDAGPGGGSSADGGHDGSSCGTGDNAGGCAAGGGRSGGAAFLILLVAGVAIVSRRRMTPQNQSARMRS